MPFTQFPPVVISYIIVVQNQSQDLTLVPCTHIVLCRFLTCVDLCNCQPRQGTALSSRGSPSWRTPLWSHPLPIPNLLPPNPILHLRNVITLRTLYKWDDTVIVCDLLGLAFLHSAPCPGDHRSY